MELHVNTISPLYTNIFVNMYNLSYLQLHRFILIHSLCGCSPLVTRMELNDANLQTLTEFLRKTLDPDPAVRRPGKKM